MSYAATTPTPSIWIRDARYDLSLVMGGALLTLGVAAAAMIHPVLLPIFFWIWIVGFEGSHFWATFSRTYIDKAFRRDNSAVLKRSLIFFALPVAAVLIDASRGGYAATTAYGAFIFLWSLYHNVRQHFGFVAIYVKKAGLDMGLAKQYRRLIYWAVGAAQIYFAMNLKLPAIYEFMPKMDAWPPIAATLLQTLPMLVSAAAALYLLRLAVRTFLSHGKAALVPAMYVGTCLMFYSTMFYLIAPGEPFFPDPANGAQLFMLIAIMNSLFHNIQYHAIVWHYANRRYTNEATEKSEGIYGLAQWVNGRALTYIGVALAVGAGFGWIVWSMGDWPSVTGAFTPTGFHAVAYVLYFGIVGHHFYLDQYIWRPSKQPELRSYLDLRAQPVA